MVLRHTDCGISWLAQALDRPTSYVGVAPNQLGAWMVPDRSASVRVNVAA